MFCIFDANAIVHGTPRAFKDKSFASIDEALNFLNSEIGNIVLCEVEDGQADVCVKNGNLQHCQFRFYIVKGI